MLQTLFKNFQRNATFYNICWDLIPNLNKLAPKTNTQRFHPDWRRYQPITVTGWVVMDRLRKSQQICDGLACIKFQNFEHIYTDVESMNIKNLEHAKKFKLKTTCVTKTWKKCINYFFMNLSQSVPHWGAVHHTQIQ